MNVVVFLGPSLPLDEANEILPGADFRPPARQADLVSALAAGPVAIGLVDGEFHQSRAVWHKEILLALEQGVPVFGAASMGALRAAELDSFGMIGVGQVFEQYLSGQLTDDDEVALLYSADGGRYRAFSEPMVNVRATLAAGVRAGVITPAQEAAAVREAKAHYYPQRTRLAVLATLRRQAAGDDESSALLHFWTSSFIDVKADDTRLLLRTLRAFADDPPPRRSVASVARTAAFDALYDRDRCVTVEGRTIALADIERHVQLHHPDCTALNAAALDRALALSLAELLQIEPDHLSVAREVDRWRARHGLEDEDKFATWQRRNHLSQQEFHQLAREGAQRRALWRWLRHSRHVERTTRLLLDHLRWENEYELWAEATARHHPLADDVEHLADALLHIEPDSLLRHHLERQGKRVEVDARTWAEEAGFVTREELVEALARASAAATRTSNGEEV